MHEPTARTVGAVARLAGVSVRTLHHYDEIGLLTPSDRSDAGYRRYADADLDRLQRVTVSKSSYPGFDDQLAIGRGLGSVFRVSAALPPVDDEIVNTVLDVPALVGHTEQALVV